jgi:hypothetical protein
MMTTGEKLLFVLMVLVTLMLIAIGHPEASGSGSGHAVEQRGHRTGQYAHRDV